MSSIYFVSVLKAFLYLIAELLMDPQVLGQEHLVPRNFTLGPRADQLGSSFNRFDQLLCGINRYLGSFDQFHPTFNRLNRRSLLSLRGRHRMRELGSLIRQLVRFFRHHILDAVVVDDVPVPVELGVGLEGAFRALVFLGKVCMSCYIIYWF